jgi:hypothetical protein
MQNDLAAIAQQRGNMRSQRLTLAAGNDPSLAAHDSDATYLTRVERELQKNSDAERINLSNWDYMLVGLALPDERNLWIGNDCRGIVER